MNFVPRLALLLTLSLALFACSDQAAPTNENSGDGEAPNAASAGDTERLEGPGTFHLAVEGMT